MNKEMLLEQFDALQKKLYAYMHSMMLLSWDSSTFAPPKSSEGRSLASSIIAGEFHKLFTSKETSDLLEALRNTSDLDEISKAKVNEMYRNHKKDTCKPKQEVIEFAKLRSETQAVWERAKSKNNYKEFAPYLKKIIEYKKRFAKYYDANAKPFNTMLDDFQRGSNMETLDKYFAEVQKNIVPLNKLVANSKMLDITKKLEERINAKGFDKESQITLADRLFDLQGLDRQRCKSSQSVHPFTTGANSNDIRFTVKYQENNLAGGVFVSLHEGGHAMHGLNLNPDFNYTVLRGGPSSSINESQARIYENNIGRSKDFNRHIYNQVKEVFPKQMSDVSADDFYLYSNASSPSYIRVEADELTYSLHIMVRYEVERMIFEDDLPVEEIPEIWSKKYEEYLGVTPPTDTQGVLQDMHWAYGMFGYFPTYSLGSAVACQLENAMRRQIDFEGSLKKGDLTSITKWLKENIHQYGKLYDDNMLLKKATGKEFDPTFYAKYLDEKYRKIYG